MMGSRYSGRVDWDIGSLNQSALGHFKQEFKQYGSSWIKAEPIGYMSPPTGWLEGDEDEQSEERIEQGDESADQAGSGRGVRGVDEWE